jgi:hypothetical protein
MCTKIYVYINVYFTCIFESPIEYTYIYIYLYICIYIYIYPYLKELPVTGNTNPLTEFPVTGGIITGNTEPFRTELSLDGKTTPPRIDPELLPSVTGGIVTFIFIYIYICLYVYMHICIYINISSYLIPYL